MRFLLALVAVAILVLIAAMMLGFVNIDQTRMASLPTVKVEGGQAPQFKAEVGKVEVGTKTVEVPTVDVQKPGEAK